MEKIFYRVMREVPGDEAHEHDLEEIFRSESLEEAKKKLNWKENLYGRIDKVNSIYKYPPIGKVWKEERFGWTDEFISTIEEN